MLERQPARRGALLRISRQTLQHIVKAMPQQPPGLAVATTACPLR